MKGFKPFFLLMTLILFSCKDTEETLPKAIDNPDPVAGYKAQKVTIDLPTGSQINLKDAQILSWNKLTAVEDNSGKVIKVEGHPAFAYLFDKDENLLLAGLIDETNTKLDLTSTAKAILYWGLSGHYYEAALGKAFFKEVEEFPIWAEWKGIVQQAWKDDPYFLQDESIGLALGQLIQKAAPNLRENVVEEELKAADLLVEDGAIQSGLQVSQVGLSQFEVANTYRRRVKGFLYKAMRTMSDGTVEELNMYPSHSHLKPDMEVEIPTISGITGFSGTVYEYMLGDTEKSFRQTSNPISIPLEIGEKDVTWKLHAVGMGKSVIYMNQTESTELVKLMILTLTLDFIVPMVADAISAKGLASESSGGPKTDEDMWAALITAVTAYLEKMPEVIQKLEKGELVEAASDFYLVGLNQYGSYFVEDLAHLAAEIIWENAPEKFLKPDLDDLKNSASRKLKIIGAIDLMLKGTDYARKIHNIKNSTRIESFKITAREIDLNLSPNSLAVSPQNSKTLTAYIKSAVAEGQVIQYQWSTTGKYGHLYDDIHKGVDFSSSKNKVSYFADAEVGKIPKNATDTIFLKAYIKQGNENIFIGAAKAVIEINDKIVFNVNWEKNIPVKEREISNGKIEYTLGQRGFEATFNYDGEVDHFELTVVRADGSKGSTISKKPEDLLENGSYIYTVNLGGIMLINTQSEAEKDQWVKKFSDELDSKKHIYHSLEVTVIPK